MVEYDMDAAKAARLEAEGTDGHQLKFGGKVYDLPSELPLDAAEALARANHRDFMKALLNGQADDFFDANPSIVDMRELISWATKVYIPGSETGESSASSDS